MYLQIAKCYKLYETKMKYTTQFGVAPYFRDLLKDVLKNIPYFFKFDETTTQQAVKNNMMAPIPMIQQYCGTMMVNHCPAEKLLEHFFEFVKKQI